jgi:hypothetical protein
VRGYANFPPGLGPGGIFIRHDFILSSAYYLNGTFFSLGSMVFYWRYGLQWVDRVLQGVCTFALAAVCIDLVFLHFDDLVMWRLILSFALYTWCVPKRESGYPSVCPSNETVLSCLLRSMGLFDPFVLRNVSTRLLVAVTGRCLHIHSSCSA